MSKETAVEWLIDEIRNCIKQNGRLDAINISKLRTMCKAMEKQQIESAYREGHNDCSLGRFSDCEQYYDQTFL
jgi:hypothetical protein